MANTETGALLARVNFEREANLTADEIQWEDELGFMYVPAASNMGEDTEEAQRTICLAGFAAPYPPYRPGHGQPEYPVLDDRPQVCSITEFRRLPPLLQCIDHTSKGVGLRFYNKLEAAVSGSDLRLESPAGSGNLIRDPYIGLYTLDILVHQIRDLRAKRDGMARQIFHHGRQRLAERRVGPEPVVDEVHASYESAGAVLMNVPPRGRWNQRQRSRADGPEEDPSAFMVLRDPNLLLVRVGRMALS